MSAKRAAAPKQSTQKIKLVVLMANALKVLKHIGQSAHVASDVQLEIVIQCRAPEGCSHAVRVVVDCRKALLTMQRAEKLFA